MSHKLLLYIVPAKTEKDFKEWKGLLCSLSTEHSVLSFGHRYTAVLTSVPVMASEMLLKNCKYIKQHLGDNRLDKRD